MDSTSRVNKIISMDSDDLMALQQAIGWEGRTQFGDGLCVSPPTATRSKDVLGPDVDAVVEEHPDVTRTRNPAESAAKGGKTKQQDRSKGKAKEPEPVAHDANGAAMVEGMDRGTEEPPLANREDSPTQEAPRSQRAGTRLPLPRPSRKARGTRARRRPRPLQRVRKLPRRRRCYQRKV